MDKLTRYRNIIKKVMTDRADLMRSQPLPGEEIICILDEATDNYILVRLGWVSGKRLYSVTLHLRLTDCQIQIEQDWTDDFVADVIEEGVDRNDLVFTVTTPPDMLSTPSYAVA